jgi:ankyrin repeat protein
MPPSRAIDAELKLAASYAQYATVRRLLQARADVHFRDEYGTLLERAVDSKRTGVDETVSALIEFGAKAAVGMPLHVAARQQQLACVKMLMRAGADPFKVDVCGMTAVDVAVLQGDSETADALLYWDEPSTRVK